MAPTALKKLDEIEAELRRIGYWSDAPELQTGACARKFQSYLDAPSFAVWLQALFLPNARAAALEGTLPARSQAGEIVRRQYAREADLPEARRLLGLIREFDALCLAASNDAPTG
jgi:uncharacterized protein YqcC (DUF446 family)